jgi:uncharacterized protein involved in type VI secretion and phage assembly
VNGDLGGVFIAKVKDPKLDEQGRIGIEIPSRNSSVRARVVAPMAGSDRGMAFLPEEGDQVVVAFVNGAPGDPLVIGSLWSSSGKPPQTDTGNKNQIKILKTRGGHSIRFVDEKDKEKIEITSPGNNTIVFDAAQKTIEITSKDGVTLKATTIKVDGDLHVTGKSTMDGIVEIGKGPKTVIDRNEIKGQ